MPSTSYSTKRHSKVKKICYYVQLPKHWLPFLFFQGFGVGNGFIDYVYILGTTAYYLYYHGSIGDR